MLGGTHPMTWEATNLEKLVAHQKTLSKDSWLLAKYGLLHCIVVTNRFQHGNELLNDLTVLIRVYARCERKKKKDQQFFFWKWHT